MELITDLCSWLEAEKSLSSYLLFLAQPNSHQAVDSQRLLCHLQGHHTPMWHQPRSLAVKHIYVQSQEGREGTWADREVSILREPHGTVHTYHTLARVNARMHCTHVLTHEYTCICIHTHRGSMGHVSVQVLMEATYRHRPPISTSVRTGPGHCSHTHIPNMLKCFHGEMELSLKPDPALALGGIQMSEPQFLHL